MKLDVIDENEISLYLTLKDHFFFENFDDGAEFQWNVKPPYLLAAQEKEGNLFKWEKLIDELFKLHGIWRIRDMSYDTMHGFKAIVTLSTEPLSGLILHLSYLGNLIGFYFADDDTSKNSFPIYQSGAQEPDLGISYKAWTAAQLRLKKDVLFLVNKFFPDFKEFNNEYASYKIKKVSTMNGILMDVDLFQVIFTTNVHGIL